MSQTPNYATRFPPLRSIHWQDYSRPSQRLRRVAVLFSAAELGYGVRAAAAPLERRADVGARAGLRLRLQGRDRVASAVHVLKASAIRLHRR